MIANLYTSRADIYHKYARVNGMKTRWGEQRNQMTENNEQVFTSHASVCAFSVVVLCECVFGYFFFPQPPFDARRRQELSYCPTGDGVAVSAINSTRTVIYINVYKMIFRSADVTV